MPWPRSLGPSPSSHASCPLTRAVLLFLGPYCTARSHIQGLAFVRCFLVNALCFRILFSGDLFQNRRIGLLGYFPQPRDLW